MIEKFPNRSVRFLYEALKYWAKWREYGIVPGFIKYPPERILSVQFGDCNVDHGNILTPTQVKDEPTVEWDCSPDKYYTLLMTDLDAPSMSKPKYREWHHWLVGNIPQTNLKEGEVLSSYIGACPPKNTSYHRIVFFLWEQKSQQAFKETRLPNTSANGRAFFSSQKFALRNLLGEPIYGNFFITKYDETVDEIFKQMNIL